MPDKRKLSIERGNRLQSIRKKAGLTRLEFAQKTGVSPNTLKAIELGERELTPQKALLFSNLFSSLFAVSLGKDAHEAKFDFLYYGTIQDSPDANKIAYDDDRLQSTINSFATNSAYMILNIEDNLMAPFYNEGDIVCGKKVTNKGNFTYFHGLICILEDLNGNKFLRRIIRSDNQRVTAFILNTTNNPNANLVEERSVNCIAQATWHWHLSEIIPNTPA